MTSGRGERGAVLGATIILALAASIAAYGMLAIALSQAREGELYRQRLPSRSAAEAGIIWAQQNLLEDPTWPSGGTAAPPLDVDGVTVQVTVTPVCSTAPCPSRRIESKVVY